MTNDQRVRPFGRASAEAFGRGTQGRLLVVGRKKETLNMNENPTQQQRSLLSRISEDWWAVIVGFVLIALVYLGLLVRLPW